MKIKIVPPNYFLIFIILGIILDYIFPIKEIITSPYSYLGILFIIIGAYFNLYVYFVYKKYKNPMNPYNKPKN